MNIIIGAVIVTTLTVIILAVVILRRPRPRPIPTLPPATTRPAVVEVRNQILNVRWGITT